MLSWAKLNNSKTKTIKIKYIFFVSKIQLMISFLAFDERNFIVMSRFISKSLENLRCEFIIRFDLFL